MATRTRKRVLVFSSAIFLHYCGPLFLRHLSATLSFATVELSSTDFYSALLLNLSFVAPRHLATNLYSVVSHRLPPILPPFRHHYCPTPARPRARWRLREGAEIKGVMNSQERWGKQERMKRENRWFRNLTWDKGVKALFFGFKGE